MNAAKFAVILVIGVLCANVSARVVVDVSQETKLGTSISKTATKGIGAELSVDAQTNSNSQGNGYVSITKRPTGPSTNANGNGFTSTSGAVSAQGPSAAAASNSGSSAQGAAQAAGDLNNAAASGNGSAGSESTAQGQTSVKKGKKENQNSVG